MKGASLPAAQSPTLRKYLALSQVVQLELASTEATSSRADEREENGTGERGDVSVCETDVKSRKEEEDDSGRSGAKEIEQGQDDWEAEEGMAVAKKGSR